MKVVPISNREPHFGSYLPPLDLEVERYCGKKWATHIHKAMTDLVPIAHIDGEGLDIIVKTIESDNILKKGISILVANEDTEGALNYIRYGYTKKYPHAMKNIYVEDVPKPESWPVVLCNTTKSLIETFKNYYSK